MKGSARAVPRQGSGVYELARAYELAFSYRNVQQEVDALVDWATACLGHAPGTALELAAGPADHALEMARRSIEVTALDLSSAMCSRASERATEAGVPLRVVEGDMRSFALDRQFEMAVVLIDSTAHLLTLDDFVANLRVTGDHLVPGGCYILEMSHPRDFLSLVPTTTTDWTIASGAERVRVRWGSQPDEAPDPLDSVSQIVQARVRVDYEVEGRLGVHTDEVIPQRLWTATEVEAVIRLAGTFDRVGRYGSFDSIPLDSPAAWRMITVLRRR